MGLAIVRPASFNILDVIPSGPVAFVLIFFNSLLTKSTETFCKTKSCSTIGTKILGNAVLELKTEHNVLAIDEKWSLNNVAVNP